MEITTSAQPHPKPIIMYLLDSTKNYENLHKGVYRLFQKKNKVQNIHYAEPEAIQLLTNALKYTQNSQGKMVETNPFRINMMCEGTSPDDGSSQWLEALVDPCFPSTLYTCTHSAATHEYTVCEAGGGGGFGQCRLKSEGKKSVPDKQFCKKTACSSYVQPWLAGLAVGGWWRLAVGGWWSLGAVLKGGP